METKRSSFVEKLSLYLSYAEIGALLVAFIGLSFFYLHFTGGREFILVGFAALAVTYFLSAFTPPESNGESEGDDEKSKGGFIDLFVKTISKKIIYLGCAVSVVGLLFGFLGSTGSLQMLLIGAATTMISCVLGGLTILINNANMKFLQGPLTRALPIGILASYWLYTHWSLISNQ